MAESTTVHPLDVPRATPPKPRGHAPKKADRRVPTHEECLAWIAQKLIDIENKETIEAEEPVPCVESATEEEKAEYERNRRSWMSRVQTRRRDLQKTRTTAPTLETYSLLCSSTETKKATDDFWRTYMSFKSKEKKEDSAGHLQNDDQRKMFRLWDALERERPDLAEAGRKSHVDRQNRVPSINRVGVRPGSFPDAPGPSDRPEPGPAPVAEPVQAPVPADDGKAPVPAGDWVD